jgi:hypothetical protein
VSESATAALNSHLEDGPMVMPRAGSGACFLVAMVGLYVLSLSGCGGDGVQRVPVKGTVTLDGKPVQKGTVIFHPDDTKGNTLATDAQGIIDGEGHFEVYVGAKAGIPTGWYNVAVVSAEDADPKTYKQVFLVPVRFSNWRTAQISREVVEKPAADAYDIKLVDK